MVKKNDMLYKIKKIGELMGGNTVIRIGIDTKKGKIDLLSADAYFSEEESKEVIAEIPDYIG